MEFKALGLRNFSGTCAAEGPRMWGGSLETMAPGCGIKDLGFRV